MDVTVTFRPDDEYSNSKVHGDQRHSVFVSVDSERSYALLKANSREALYELGRSLMEQALFGDGELEFYPLLLDGKALVVNGVRLSEGSARLFVHYPSAESADG